MKQVFYNGHSYEYRVSERDGVRVFSLYEKGVLRYNLRENDLDKRTLVSLILDSYFTRDRQKSDSSGSDRPPTMGKIYTPSPVSERQ